MRIVVNGGLSGGHSLPAAALAEGLKRARPAADVTLVLPRAQAAAAAGLDDVRVRYLSLTHIRMRPVRAALRSWLCFVKGCAESLLFLSSYRPDVIVAFGGMPSAALAVFGWMMRIPVVIHEQNVVFGKANRFLARLADTVCVAFEESRSGCGFCAHKIRFTGMPLRRSLVEISREQALGFFGFKDDRLTLLVMGGSQGSRSLNQAFLDCMERFPSRDTIQVIHLAGGQEYERVSLAYQRMGLSAQVFTFLEKMEYALSVADLAVSRAGASTIHELMRFRLPAVLIPYPFALQHQRYNAAVLQAQKAAYVIDDDGALGARLCGQLQRLCADRALRQQMRQAYRPAGPTDPTAAMIDIVMETAG